MEHGKIKEFKKACWDATQNWEGPQPKLGLTPINKRKFKIWRLVLHVAAEECYCVWTDCGRVGVKQHCVEALNKNDIALKGKKGTLNNASYATTRTTPTTSHKPPCSTRPLLFTQPVKFNHTGRWTSHRPRLQQLLRTTRCTNSISTTTTTTFHETATHLRISTHFTHVSRH